MPLARNGITLEHFHTALSFGPRIEDWKPLFLAATSAIVANSMETVAIQMLPSFLCRNDYERSIALQAIRVNTLKEAFELLSGSLDQPIDEFEALSLFRKTQWARGVPIEVFSINC